MLLKRNVFKLLVLVPTDSVVLATRHNGLPLLQLSRILGESIPPNFDEIKCVVPKSCQTNHDSRYVDTRQNLQIRERCQPPRLVRQDSTRVQGSWPVVAPHRPTDSRVLIDMHAANVRSVLSPDHSRIGKLCYNP
ncbi:hypothetical protein BJ912DRAFT_956558 [Pholiota molesta]|nr:hypothetical protein BJ912DRAFT_956558 [Pholiota molesta]